LPARRPLLVWFKRFPSPILLANGCRLLTLQDASDYMEVLTLAKRNDIDWQLAGAALVVAAERDGPVTMARTAVVRALSRGNPGSLPNSPDQPPPRPPKLRIVR
jgi:hypothetical protein